MTQDVLEAIREIMNHITVINDDYTKLAVTVAVLQSQVADLVWWFRATAGAIVFLLITQIWQVLILRRNNRNHDKK